WRKLLFSEGRVQHSRAVQVTQAACLAIMADRIYNYDSHDGYDARGSNVCDGELSFSPPAQIDPWRHINLDDDTKGGWTYALNMLWFSDYNYSQEREEDHFCYQSLSLEKSEGSSSCYDTSGEEKKNLDVRRSSWSRASIDSAKELGVDDHTWRDAASYVKEEGQAIVELGILFEHVLRLHGTSPTGTETSSSDIGCGRMHLPRACPTFVKDLVHNILPSDKEVLKKTFQLALEGVSPLLNTRQELVRNEVVRQIILFSGGSRDNDRIYRRAIEAAEARFKKAAGSGMSINRSILFDVSTRPLAIKVLEMR
ncbi:unnamed protein product, partial [Chrysoparadoxa australica]